MKYVDKYLINRSTENLETEDPTIGEMGVWLLSAQQRNSYQKAKPFSLQPSFNSGLTATDRTSNV